MLFLDPPDHTRLRSLVNQAFTPRVVDALEPHIRTVMHELLDAVDDPAGFDLMRAVAGPLPVIVIAEMLGVPPEDRARFAEWSHDRARILEPLVGARERERAAAAGEAFDACRSSRLAGANRATTSSAPSRRRRRLATR